MRVFTSYYTRASRLKLPATFVQVSASRPGWWSDPIYELPELYPDWSLIRGIKDGTLTEDDYLVRYNQQLSKLNGEEVVSKLVAACEENHGYSDVILLCWCGPKSFCHRHAIGLWLPVEVSELQNELY